MDNIGPLLDAYLDNIASPVQENQLFAAVESGEHDIAIGNRFKSELLADLRAEFAPKEQEMQPFTHPAQNFIYGVTHFTCQNLLAKREASELISAHVLSGKIASIKVVADGIMAGCRDSYFAQFQPDNNILSVASCDTTKPMAPAGRLWTSFGDRSAVPGIVQGSFVMGTVVRPDQASSVKYDVDEIAALLHLDHGVTVFVSVKLKDSLFPYSPEFTYTEILDTVAKKYKVACSPLGEAVCIIDDKSNAQGVDVDAVEFRPVMVS